MSTTPLLYNRILKPPTLGLPFPSPDLPKPHNSQNNPTLLIQPCTPNPIPLPHHPRHPALPTSQPHILHLSGAPTHHPLPTRPPLDPTISITTTASPLLRRRPQRRHNQPARPLSPDLAGHSIHHATPGALQRDRARNPAPIRAAQGIRRQNRKLQGHGQIPRPGVWSRSWWIQRV